MRMYMLACSPLPLTETSNFWRREEPALPGMVSEDDCHWTAITASHSLVMATVLPVINRVAHEPPSPIFPIEMIGDFYNDDDNDIHLLLRKDQRSLIETAYFVAGGFPETISAIRSVRDPQSAPPFQCLCGFTAFSQMLYEDGCG